MWIEYHNNIFKVYGNFVPFYILILVPVFALVLPVRFVVASHEFLAFRMGQYDLHGVPYGCRNVHISLEAKSLDGWSTQRHCVIARAENLTYTAFQKIRQKAGALVVVLPENVNALTGLEKQHLMSLEESMMSESETVIPVYFVKWNPQLQIILNNVEQISESQDRMQSGTKALFDSISTSNYHVVVSASQAIPKTDFRIATMHGKLAGTGTEDKLPSIVLVANYDSLGIAPELSFGAESNASGLAMLLELARIFSQFYHSAKMRPQFNLIFVITGAGKLNYQGSKKWLEDQLDGPEAYILQDASYVICLESVSASDTLHIHVSKPPKEISVGGIIYKQLKIAADLLGQNIEGTHKKINLAEEKLAWEHERFSMRRFSAATLSSLKSFGNPVRNTIFDTFQEDQINKLYNHTNIVAEALVRYMYNISYKQIFTEELGISKDFLSMWMKFLTSQPRAAVLLIDKQNHLVNSLKDVMQNIFGDVKTTLHGPDKRDPEFILYDSTTVTIHFYSVKPAVFDLLLTCGIVMYLGALCLIIHLFPNIYSPNKIVFCKFKAS